MPTYKIIKIDRDATREWGEGAKKIYYIKVALRDSDGKVHPKAVSIGKKKPDALSVGEEVHGTIEKTDYETDKWHGDAPQGSFGSFSGGSGAPKREYVDHHEDIKAQWAIGKAAELFGHTDKVLNPGQKALIKENALYFHSLVEHVKAGSVPAPEPHVVSDSEPLPDFPGDEPINLDEIPF